MSYITNLGGGGGAGTVISVTGNIGGAISPDAAGNINIVGTIEELQSTGAGSTLTFNLDPDLKTNIKAGWFGSLMETPSVVVTSDGTTVTLAVERNGGGDLTVIFSDGYYDWDTTPADTVTLTPGSNSSPQVNYIYFLHSTNTLTSSTSGWPATAAAPIATVLCQSAASVQTEGPYKVHAWIDHLSSTPTSSGHIGHINLWIREQHATWDTGVAPTLTITPQGAAADDVIFTTGSGSVLQLHKHSFPAFTGTPDLYVVNDPVLGYKEIANLNTCLTTSGGDPMTDKYFSLVIWGVISEVSGDCKLMVNLPSNVYSSEEALLEDSMKYSDYSIPRNFKGSAFLIARLDLLHESIASGTWTEIRLVDLRGLYPSLAAGGSTADNTVFDDNVFRIQDFDDNTKDLAFEIDTVTTGTTRTITMCDRDLDLTSPTFTTVNATTFDTDVAAAGLTLSATSLIADGTDADININITAKGAGQVIINELSLSTDLAVSEGGTGSSSLTDHGLLLGSGVSPITATAAPIDGELIIGSTGNDPVLATLIAGSGIDVANAPGSITISSTTSGISINTQTGTTYTLVLGDDGKFISLDNVAPITLTVPPNSSVALPLGSQVILYQKNNGTVTVAEGTGVAVHTDNGGKDLMDRYSVALLVKIEADVWSLRGAVRPDPVIVLTVPEGGTGVATLPDHGLLLGSGTGAVTTTSAPLDGELVIGSTGNDPAVATLTAGSGVNIVNIPGGITISAPGAGGTSFPDNVFRIYDEGDTSKLLAFECSQVSAATTRTITMANRNINLDTPTFTTVDATIDVTSLALRTSDSTRSLKLSGNTIECSGSSPDSDININSKGGGYVKINKLQINAALGATYGGTGLATLTDHGILLGSGTSPITMTAEPSDGELLIGSTTNDPVLATLTGGAGVSIVNAPGSITISSSGGTVFNDDVFRVQDEGDTTKKMAFQISGVTTSTTRTITMCDYDLDLTNPTFTTVNATTFDTNVAAAGLTLAGTSLVADGTNANININITAKGTGYVVINNLRLTADLTVPEGGTGVSILTDHGVLIGSGASPITATAALQDGQLVIGNTSNDPSIATLTGIAGISITNAAGSISIGNATSINAQTGTSYTLVLTDNGKIITLTNAATVTLTIPLNSSVAFPVGTTIFLYQGGAGMLRVAATTGVTIRSASSLLDLYTQYSTATLIKLATDTWSLSGDLA